MWGAVTLRATTKALKGRIPPWDDQRRTFRGPDSVLSWLWRRSLSTAPPPPKVVPRPGPMPRDTITRMLAPFLDPLTVEELEAMPCGVIARWIRASSRMCPGARIPAFYGRFADGVRDERPDERFAFTCTGTRAPRLVRWRTHDSVRSRSVRVFVAKPAGAPLTAPAAPARTNCWEAGAPWWSTSRRACSPS